VYATSSGFYVLRAAVGINGVWLLLLSPATAAAVVDAGSLPLAYLLRGSSIYSIEQSDSMLFEPVHCT
jgi:hypothetical protein